MSARVTREEIAAESTRLHNAGDEQVETGYRRRRVALAGRTPGGAGYLTLSLC